MKKFLAAAIFMSFVFYPAISNAGPGAKATKGWILKESKTLGKLSKPVSRSKHNPNETYEQKSLKFDGCKVTSTTLRIHANPASTTTTTNVFTFGADIEEINATKSYVTITFNKGVVDSTTTKVDEGRVLPPKKHRKKGKMVEILHGSRDHNEKYRLAPRFKNALEYLTRICISPSTPF